MNETVVRYNFNSGEISSVILYVVDGATFPDTARLDISNFVKKCNSIPRVEKRQIFVRVVQ